MPDLTAHQTITVRRPHVPFGPANVSPEQADADYLRSAAKNIEFSRCMGSNLTATVVRLLHDAADAIEGVTPRDTALDFALRAHRTDALSPVLAQMKREWQAEALGIVRQVESDMAERALLAWRSADARRGLSDHEALVVHADALTRWSERFRMAFKGEYYRAEASGREGERGCTCAVPAAIGSEPCDRCGGR